MLVRVGDGGQLLVSGKARYDIFPEFKPQNVKLVHPMDLGRS